MRTTAAQCIGRLATLIRPNATVLVAGLGVAFAPVATRADSVSGTDTSAGNAMSQGIAAGPPRVEADIDPKRSPIGILFGPRDLLSEPRKTVQDGWLYRAEVEFGGLDASGDHRNPLFGRYRDVDSGLVLHHLAVDAEKPDTATFVRANAGSVARDDQFHSIAFGRHNAWKVRAFFNETPSVATNTFRSLWNGIGTDRQTLATLTPGGQATPDASLAALRNAIAAAPETELAITRKKGGVRVDVTLSETWKLYADYTAEKKRGAAPYAATFGAGDGGGNFEFAESVDSTTHDFQGGISYFDRVNSFNLTLQGSLYRNAIDTLTVENPLAIAVNTVAGVPAGTFMSARFDMYPDNNHYKAKAEYARNLPSLMNGRFSAVVAATRSQQDDALIAPTALPLTGGTINGISAANRWNTLDSLSRRTSGAEIETTLVNLGLSLNPAPSATLRANLRRYETDNSTDFLACNPLTGQWGRLLNDGSGGAFVNTPAYLAAGCDLAAVRALGVSPSAGNINIRAVPFQYTQTNYTLAADWRATARSNVTGSFEREEYDREHRERDKTREDKVKVGFTNRGFDNVTLLFSLENARRRGSAYVANPYEEFLSASMGPLPTGATGNFATWIHAIDSFRRFDLADRDSRTANGRINWAVMPDVDVGLSAQFRDTRYPDAEFGRNGTNRDASVSVEANWQASAEFALYGYYTWQSRKMHQTGLQANSCVAGVTYFFYSNGEVNTTGIAPAGATRIGSTQVTAANAIATCAAAGPLSPLFPAGNSWEQFQEQRNHAASIGLRRDFGLAKLDASYTYASGRSTSTYLYNAAALSISAAEVALVGSGFPEARLVQNTVEANLTYPIGRSMSARLYYRYERGRISDWHYDGVAGNPAPDAFAAYLDGGPGNYSASTVGLFIRVAF
ncbi:MAG TPA: MtrB/PioB family outer membrane beta-barrel protein [Usitatibacteraceae bacterium]|nr:MtrB/PioB family outer membrane beta-barrel protein [Usitatibacteraceae bacterium]